jgi:DNA primase
MATRIPEETLKDVLMANPVEAVVGEYAPLRPRILGLEGTCPFCTGEPFRVRPDTQIYRCYVCGESGNVIAFVMHARHVNFGDAVTILAQRAGIALPTAHATDSPGGPGGEAPESEEKGTTP